jgi:hypothetical protein
MSYNSNVRKLINTLLVVTYPMLLFMLVFGIGAASFIQQSDEFLFAKISDVP